MKRIWKRMILVTVSAVACGCGHAVTKSTKVPVAERPVAREASEEELLDRYNALARGLKSIDATLELKPTAGSKYSGVIDEYNEVKAFLLAARRAQVRMIGQAPVVGTTVFDMASDGDTLRVSIPSKPKFLTGLVAAEKNSSKPIENFRPQHLLDALLW